MFGDYCKRYKTTEAKLQAKHRHPMYETNIKIKTLLGKWGSLPELCKHGLQPLNLRHGTMLPWAYTHNHSSKKKNLPCLHVILGGHAILPKRQQLTYGQQKSPLAVRMH